MPIDANLPETAKALGAPVTRLIEVVAAGCGKVYEPTGIRRKARADADALVIVEEARARVSEISLRAARRMLDVEERRQINIDAIVEESSTLLPRSVSEEHVSNDWAARFFNDCQDISNEQMRSIWAKVLAGEVTTPGSFAPRTLWVLKNLLPDEAQDFNTLCKLSFRDPSGHIYPYVGIGDPEFWRGFKLNFLALQSLADAGLITYHPDGLEFGNIRDVTIWSPKMELRILSDRPAALQAGEVSMTTAGDQLGALCEWDIPEGRIANLIAAIGEPFRVEIVQRP